MRALINGVEGGAQTLFKGQDATWLIQLLEDTGALIDVTGDTITLNFYDRVDRLNAATLTVTVALTTVAAGFTTATITDTNTGTLTAGATYYCFVKRDDGTAGVFSFANNYTVVYVK